MIILLAFKEFFIYLKHHYPIMTKLKKIISKKAVSPIIAVILIIALTVAAAALIYFVVVPMLQGNPELIMKDQSYIDSNEDYYVDEARFTITNLGSSATTINDIKLFKDLEELDWISETALPSDLNVQGSKTFYLTADPAHNDVFKFPDRIWVHLYYGRNKEKIIPISIPAQFTPYELVYYEDFNNRTNGWNPEGWLYNFVADHSGGTNYHTIDDWSAYNMVLRCTTNDCNYLILDDYYFADVNISFDLMAPTDDAQGTDINGIIFRYGIDEGIPKYYMVCYTNDHTLTDGRNGPHYPDGDTMQKNILYLMYVEGFGGEGTEYGNITILAQASWNRVNNQWYTYKLISQGDNIKLYVDDVLLLEADDNKLSVGRIGLFSGALMNSEFDNILVWRGTKE